MYWLEVTWKRTRSNKSSSTELAFFRHRLLLCVKQQNLALVFLERGCNKVRHSGHPVNFGLVRSNNTSADTNPGCGNPGAGAVPTVLDLASVWVVPGCESNADRSLRNSIGPIGRFALAELQLKNKKGNT